VWPYFLAPYKIFFGIGLRSVSLRAKKAFSPERKKACPERSRRVEGEAISIVRKQEIATATFCGLAMTKVVLLDLVNEY